MEERDQTMVARDSSITTLQRQSLGVVDKLKVCSAIYHNHIATLLYVLWLQTAWATIDARDSTIVKLQYQLKTEQGKMKTYEEQTPTLEAKVHVKNVFC